MNEEIKQMQEEVTILAKQIEDICKSDPEVDNLYLGTQIYYSPLKEKMEIMFIGINPGPGRSKGKVKFSEINPLEKSEYETEEFTLQQEWHAVFKEMNNIDLLYNSFKTNCSFLATNGINELDELKRILKHKYKIHIDLKEKEWVTILTKYVNPKIIICEGFAAFDKVIEIFNGDRSKIWSTTADDKIGYINIHNEFCVVLGFARRYSTLRTKDLGEVADLINDAINRNL